jgi:hypothetical protein
MWKMLAEPYPGCSVTYDAKTADRLKTLAKEVWKGNFRTANRVLFTIYNPRGEPWERCERVAGGSWRARWEPCAPSAAADGTD